MQNDKIPFEKKKGKMDYLLRVGADVNTKLYGKSMVVWVNELGDENLVQYVKENKGEELEISEKQAEELGREFWSAGIALKCVDEIKKLVIKGANLGVVNDDKKQIWQYLEVDEINSILKDLPKGYVIDGDVDLGKRNLTKLPDFSNVVVGGNFCCDNGILTSLEGSPKEVKGYFDCRNNELTTLKGAPEKLGDSFDCYGNKLDNLEGAPLVVEGFFNCAGCGLTTLKGAPRIVKGDFVCASNKITSLKDGPEYVGVEYNCSRNRLSSLEGAPNKIGGNFYCRENQLISLSGKPEHIVGAFDIEKEVLQKLEGKNLEEDELEKNKEQKSSLWGKIFGSKAR